MRKWKIMPHSRAAFRADCNKSRCTSGALTLCIRIASPACLAYPPREEETHPVDIKALFAYPLPSNSGSGVFFALGRGTVSFPAAWSLRLAPEWHVKNGIHKSILGRYHGNESLFRHAWLVPAVLARLARSRNGTRLGKVRWIGKTKLGSRSARTIFIRCYIDRKRGEGWGAGCRENRDSAHLQAI